MNILSFPNGNPRRENDYEPATVVEVDEELELILRTKLLVDLLMARANEPAAISLETVKLRIREQEQEPEPRP